MKVAAISGSGGMGVDLVYVTGEEYAPLALKP